MLLARSQKLSYYGARIPLESPTLKTRWFYVFFFVSGFCSLVYEVIWLRLAMAKFGITTPMVSIVLSVFMAGLGIGSWAGGIFIRRFGKASAAIPLRLYALVELVIGLSGFLAPLTITAGYNFLRQAGNDLTWGSSVYYLASGGWIVAALLPWCICMGATFPFAMAAIRKMGGSGAEHSFSYLYLANVLGAVMGTLVPAFLLIELMGFQGTLRVASLLNALLAASVFALSFGAWPSLAAPIEEKAPITERSENGLLWLLFTTGICSMAMEVVWIREFTVYLGNVVYAFAVILALYLLATFAGSSVYRRQVHKEGSRALGTAWIPLGLFTLLPLLFADPRWPIPHGESTAASLGLGAIRAGLGIIPVSAWVGFLTPMLVDRWSGGSPERAGRAYAVNILGSLLGPLVAGFWILPLAGESWGLCLIALPLFAIGLTSAARAADRMAYGATVAAAVLLAMFTKNYATKFPQRIELRDHTATVIATGEGMGRQLLINGTGMTKLTPITKMMAHLPLGFLPRAPKNGLIICFGMGTSFRSMLSWGIDATVVELVPSVPKLFGFFHPDGPELMKSGRAHVVIDDGRRFLERSTEQFDVIAADPPPPIGAPTSSLLYSLEFYSIIKPHLRAGGMLQVWCPGGDEATMSAVTKSIRRSFPYVRAYESIEGWGTHFLASMTPIPEMSGKDLLKRMPAGAAADLVEWETELTAEGMLSDVMDAEESLDDLIKPDADARPIADDRPINEYFLLRSVNAKEEN